MSTSPHQRLRRAGDRSFPFFLAETSGSVIVRGQAEWVSDDAAYVLVPYGTARSSRQRWEATMFAGPNPDPSRGCHSPVQLIAADHRLDAHEDTEGLLLRFLRPVRSLM